MEPHVYGPVNTAVASAKLLGGLDSCTIWALFSLCLIGERAWKERKDIENNDKWRLIREGQIASEVAQTEVLRRQTEEIVGMKLMLTKLTVKE